MNQSSRFILNLSTQKRALLEALSQEAGLTSAAASKIPRRIETGSLLLSFAQQRLWFLDQLDPRSPAFNIAKAIRVQGALDRAALQQSLNEIVARHEALRTTFRSVEGRPAQVITPAQPLALPVIDLENVPKGEREACLLQQAQNEVRQPFDLQQGPLLRALLIRLDEEEHVLLLAVHHIAFDGWSVAVFLQELAALYPAFAAGEPPSLPELLIQYADYAVWQREWLQGPALASLLSYWKQQLGGDLSPLALPTDRPRPPVPSYRALNHLFEVPKPVAAGLKELSRRGGVTLFMTLLAAFQTLLSRYTGQDDVLVGTPIANRSHVELEGLIGFFVNTLVLRTDLSGDPTFRELLGQVREVALGAYAHQDLPFEKLVEELQPQRDLSHAPFFHVMFAMQNTPAQTRELPGLMLSPMDVETGTWMLDVTLSMTEEPDGLTGRLAYDADLFEAATIQRMVGHYQRLLEGIVADPEQRLSALPLLTEGERRQLLVEWNDTAAASPREPCAHSLFEVQAARTPEAVAVRGEAGQLTYRELNQRANQLAHYLRQRGVGPEALVGICMERSLEMVVGLLGVLKAGGAYVPLDPCYPKERLAFMLRDSRAPVLLTQQRLLGALPGHEAETVCLDMIGDALARESHANPVSQTATDSLAYVIYTSGSTGEPKGVQIPHGALVNLLSSMSREPGLSREDVLLSLTTLSFDIATLELLLPLSVGASIVMVSREVATDGMRLIRALDDSGATVMQATPATWQMLLEAGWRGSRHLKILCGGEALPRELANSLMERSSSLWNLYGPTETTIYSTAYRVEPGDGPVPIGRPIANTRTYVLDRHGQPVPLGVPGELHLGGRGLARGYLARPALTAAKFISDPFSASPHARLYKTGDRVRYRRDGNLEFLGRLDDQVKLRGFRIEPGEIEAVLRQHPGVWEAVVAAREERPGDKRLVAYVVPSEAGRAPRDPEDADAADERCWTDELRRYLREKLPEYMVPGAIVELAALPRLANGKVNRRALSAPQVEGLSGDAGHEPPGTPLEKVVAGIWREVLRVERVGRHDDFFALGGHSLLATQVIARLRNLFEVELPLRCLFDAPSVAGLAATTRQRLAAAVGPLEMAQMLTELEELS